MDSSHNGSSGFRSSPPVSSDPLFPPNTPAAVVNFDWDTFNEEVSRLFDKKRVLESYCRFDFWDRRENIRIFREASLSLPREYGIIARETMDQHDRVCRKWEEMVQETENLRIWVSRVSEKILGREREETLSDGICN
jgi:hypothetical protein